MNSILKAFLETVAPTVLSAAIGPFSGIAVAGLTKILGIDGGTVADVTRAISEGRVTPEQVAEIRKLELQYQADEKERGFRYAELEFKDVASAREMQISTQSWVPAALSVVVVVGYFTILIGMMYGKLHVSDNQYLLILIGALATAFGGVLNFWLGSSHGSQAKSAMLANSVPSK